MRAAAPRGTHDCAAWNPLASGTLTTAATHHALRMVKRTGHKHCFLGCSFVERREISTFRAVHKVDSDGASVVIGGVAGMVEEQEDKVRTLTT
jgi:hypothetical protein